MRLEDRDCDMRASMASTNDTKKLSSAKQEKAIMHDFEMHVKGGSLVNVAISVVIHLYFS